MVMSNKYRLKGYTFFSYSKELISKINTLLVHRKYNIVCILSDTILNVRPPPMDSISHVIYICANMNLSNIMIRTLLVNMKKYFPFVIQLNIRPNIKDLIDHEAFICTWLNFNITIILIFKSSPLPGFNQIDTGTFIYTIAGL